MAVEIIQQLIADGARVTAYDPKVASLPEPLNSALVVAKSPDAVFKGSDAVVLATEWPEFRELDFAALVSDMKRALLIDQNAFAAKPLCSVPTLDHIIAGKVR